MSHLLPPLRATEALSQGGFFSSQPTGAREITWVLLTQKLTKNVKSCFSDKRCQLGEIGGGLVLEDH